MNRRYLVFTVVFSLFLAGCQSSPSYEGSNGEINLDTGQYENSPANTFIQLAIAYMEQGQMTVALKYAKRAVQQDASHPDAYNIRGLIYQRLGQYSKAEHDFRKALSISPNNPRINNTYGSFLCELKKIDKALIYFEKTISHPLYEQKWVPMTNAGICALRVNNLEVAQDYLRKALQNNGKYRIALYNMVEVSVLQKNYWSARAYLQRYLEVGQHDSKTLWWGIHTERELGDRDKLDSFKLLLRAKFPDSEEAHMLMADKKQE